MPEDKDADRITLPIEFIAGPIGPGEGGVVGIQNMKEVHAMLELKFGKEKADQAWETLERVLCGVHNEISQHEQSEQGYPTPLGPTGASEPMTEWKAKIPL